MDLDTVAVEIRPRVAQESIDLGFHLARANAKALWGAFLPVYGCFVLIACSIFSSDPIFAAIFIWWFKPCYDRVALHVLSRSVFGATPRIIDTLRALPGMFRRGAFAALLHMRFDLARSLNLAPWQLEELPWSQWRRRVKLLETPVRSTAGGLTVVCLYFELTIVVGLFALAAWLVPPELYESVSDWWFSIQQSESLAQWSVLGAWVVAVAIIEPFFVAGGFGLYLNRRTELEAWDIEIAFRRMARRHMEHKTQLIT